MHEVINYIVNIVADLGYIGIFIMMVLESSFFPFPSEVAMIPGGYLISTGEMSFLFVFLSGTTGALIGATINYFLGKYLGRPIILKLIDKYGKYFLIKQKHYKKTEDFFNKHGEITTFIARFITVIRQLISIPAGVFKMNFYKFIFYTFLGAGAWNIILISIGYIAGENKDLIAKYSKQALLLGILFVVIVVLFYYFKNKKSAKR